MRVKLTQPGWETYTGQMGVVFFHNGISTDHVSTRDAVRMAAVMNCEWEDGSNLSPTNELLMVHHNAAPVVAEPERGVDENPETKPVEEEEVRIFKEVISGPPPTPAPVVEEPLMEVADPAPTPAEEPAAPAGRWTQAELEAIADKEGISGLRALSDPLEIKARSITDLIAALVKVPAAE